MSSGESEIIKVLEKHGPTVATTAALGAAAGTAAAVMAQTPPHFHRASAFNPSANFAQAAVSSIQQGGSVAGALTAGATAMVGGPAVIAGAVAAAPFVLGGLAVVAVGLGVAALISDD